MDDSDSHGINTYFVASSDEFCDLTQGVLDAQNQVGDTKSLFKLWQEGLTILHEDNIMLAVYSGDTAARLLLSSPGVLSKGGCDDVSDCDSNATVEELVLSKASLPKLFEAEQLIAKTVASTAAPQPFPLTASKCLTAPKKKKLAHLDTVENCTTTSTLKHLSKFEQQSLCVMEGRVEEMCRCALRAQYLSASSNGYLSSCEERLNKFLTTSQGSKEGDVENLRTRCATVLRAIEATRQMLSVVS